MAKTVKKETVEKVKKAAPKKKATPRTKKVAPKLKGTKTKPKAKPAKKKIVENIEILELKSDDWKTEMFDQSQNCLWREAELKTFTSTYYRFRKDADRTPKTYWDLGGSWLWTCGRATYAVTEMRIFDENGVIYETQDVFRREGLSRVSSPYVRFKDIEKISLKKKEDFKLDEPFMINTGKPWYSNRNSKSHAILYLPKRYLDEMSYTFKEEIKTDDSFNSTYTKRLVTRFFSFEVEEKKWTDFEEQKKELLKQLKSCKGRGDVAKVVRKVTNLYIDTGNYTN